MTLSRRVGLESQIFIDIVTITKRLSDGCDMQKKLCLHSVILLGKVPKAVGLSGNACKLVKTNYKMLEICKRSRNYSNQLKTARDEKNTKKMVKFLKIAKCVNVESG